MDITMWSVLKAAWGFLTFILMGVLKYIWSDYKKMQERQDAIEKEMIRMKADMVTKDRLDETLDRKVKHLQDSLQDVRSDLSDLRREVKSEVSGLRDDIQTLLKTVLETRHRG